MIQAIIFDFGGVLVRTQDRSHRKQWEDRLGLAEWESEQLVFNSDMGMKAQRGEISDKALWQWVGQQLHLDATELAAFRHAFWAGDVLDRSLVDLIRGLRPFYQTAIISNATDGLRPALHTTYPIAAAFDLIVVSAEEKVMKPAPDIYLRALARLGRQPDEAVFIDDFAHNIAAAQQLGMATIHYQPGTDIAAHFVTMGIHTPPPHR